MYNRYSVCVQQGRMIPNRVHNSNLILDCIQKSFSAEVIKPRL